VTRGEFFRVPTRSSRVRTSNATEPSPPVTDAHSPVRPIHVLHVFGTLLPGGAERQALALVRHRDAARVRYSVVNCNAAGAPNRPGDGPIQSLMDEFSAAGCECHLLDKFSRSTVAFIWELRNLIRRIAPDIVHTWLYAPSFWGRGAALLAGGCSVVASTRTAKPYGRLLPCRLDRWLSRWTAARVVNSQEVRRMLIEHVGVPADRIEVIYNGIEPERFNVEVDGVTARKRFGWAVDIPLLLAVGRLADDKNYPMLFRVTDRLRASFPNVRVIIAGAGPQEDALRRLCKDMGLSPFVQFLGWRQDVADLMAAADLFVMTSSWEGFPNALLEAMGAGCAVVSTRVSGAEELVEHGRTGILVGLDDDESMTKHIAELLNEPSRRRALGEEARRIIRSRYTVEAMARAHETLYEKVVADARTFRPRSS
jgi:glycosyltransferase involved in cell wall biosynthesis